MTTHCAFSSGMYKKRYFGRRVHVWKYCRRVLIRGLHSAMNSGTIAKMTVIVNGETTERYNVHHDKIVFWDLLEPKTEEMKLWIFRWNVRVPTEYRIQVNILFEELEPARYWTE